MSDDSEFEGIAEALLARWAEAIEDQENDAVFVDSTPGVVTIEIDDAGTFVVSKHGPTRQIWLSSPISGASHFKAAGDRWISTRGDGADLAIRLASELKEAAGLDLVLD